jgi:hypothetical protein
MSYIIIKPEITLTKLKFSQPKKIKIEKINQSQFARFTDESLKIKIKIKIKRPLILFAEI